RYHVAHGFAGQTIHELLKAFRLVSVNRMRRYFDLEMRSNGIQLAVEIFQKQDQPEVRILELELITAIAAHTGGMETIAGKIDHAGLVTEQRQQFGPQQ